MTEERKPDKNLFYMSGFLFSFIFMMLLVLFRGFFEEQEVLWSWLICAMFLLFWIFTYYFLKELKKEWKKTEVI